MKNQRNDFYIGNAVTEFSKNEQYKELFSKFKILEQYKHINKEFNSFAHTNGIKYINFSSAFYCRNQTTLRNICKMIREIILFFTLLFLSLQTIFNPISISSSDYVLSLDMGLKPEENSQYWVAPIIKAYFIENEKYIGTGLVKYLQGKTSMEFD